MKTQTLEQKPQQARVVQWKKPQLAKTQTL
jgi:hypothetical protein